jgi:hypothetical protein
VAETKSKKMRPGTKPKGPYQDKRAALTTRITQETRSALEDAARVSGRSLSQEIEFRLVQSIRDEDGFGGNENAALFRMLAGAAGLIEARTSKEWMKDWDTYIAVDSAWKRLIGHAGPPPPRELMDRLEIPEELKTLPTPPEYPYSSPLAKGLMDGLNRDKSGEELSKEFEQAQSRYGREKKKYEKLWAEFKKESDERLERFNQAKGLGLEVFREFFPPSKRGS